MFDCPSAALAGSKNKLFHFGPCSSEAWREVVFAMLYMYIETEFVRYNYYQLTPHGPTTWTLKKQTKRERKKQVKHFNSNLKNLLALA